MRWWLARGLAPLCLIFLAFVATTTSLVACEGTPARAVLDLVAPSCEKVAHDDCLEQFPYVRRYLLFFEVLDGHLMKQYQQCMAGRRARCRYAR